MDHTFFLRRIVKFENLDFFSYFFSLNLVTVICCFIQMDPGILLKNCNCNISLGMVVDVILQM